MRLFELAWTTAGCASTSQSSQTLKFVVLKDCQPLTVHLHVPQGANIAYWEMQRDLTYFSEFEGNFS